MGGRTATHRFAAVHHGQIFARGARNNGKAEEGTIASGVDARHCHEGTQRVTFLKVELVSGLRVVLAAQHAGASWARALDGYQQAHADVAVGWYRHVRAASRDNWICTGVVRKCVRLELLCAVFFN